LRRIVRATATAGPVAVALALALALALAGTIAGAAPAAAGAPACTTTWTTGTAPPTDPQASVCVGPGRHVLDGAREWGSLTVPNHASIDLIDTAVDCPAPAITLHVDGAALIATGAAIRLHTSCATGGDSALQVGGTLTVDGTLDVEDCDTSPTPFCGGARTISGTLDNAGTVTVNNAATAYTGGGTWTNAGSLTLLGSGSLSLPDSAAETFDNATGGVVNANGVTDRPTFVVGSGDTYHQDGGSTVGSPIALEGATLRTGGAGTADIAVFGLTTWASGDLAAGQTLEVSCTGSNTLATTAAATNHGTIEFSRPYDDVCTDVPALDLTSGPLTNAVDGVVEAVASDGNVLGAGGLTNDGQVAALTNNLTLDAAPENLAGHVLTDGTWIARAGSLGWPAAPATDVNEIAADVQVIGAAGELPNFTSLGRVDSGGSLSVLMNATLTTGSAGLDNAGDVVIGGDGGAGTLTVPDGGSYLQTAGSTRLGDPAAVLRLGPTTPGTATVSGGELAGVGTIAGDVDVTAGSVDPGDAAGAGTLAVTGSYSQADGVVLHADLAADPPGPGFDQVTAATADLGGALEEAVAPDFTPTPGSSYPVVSTSGGLTGAFSTVTCDPAFDCTASYTPTEADLVAGRQHSTTALSRSAQKVAYGAEQAERLTVTARGAHGGRPAGRAVVSEAGHRLCTVTLVAGRGSCRLRPLALDAGTHHLTAQLRRSDAYAASASRPVTVVVARAHTRTTVRFRGGRFHVAVAPHDAGAPTGRVVVTAGHRTLCTATLHQRHGGPTGTCGPGRLARGVRTKVVATYSGDRNFRSSRGRATVTRH
jgi:hypothetical protein